MASKSFKLVFLLIVVISFFNFSITEADDDITYFNHDCEVDGGVANSTYHQVQENLIKTLLSSLSSKATNNTFYNDTVVDGRNASDPVYGLFMCRGDIPSQLCGHCVLNATQKLYSFCNMSMWAVIWYDECMVRYSISSSFFSTVDTDVSVIGGVSFSTNFSNQALLGQTLNKTAHEAAFSGTGNRYATKIVKLSENQTLYCLVQCTRDLSPQNCTSCLAFAMDTILGKHGRKVFTPSCSIRYQLYPFFGVNMYTTGPTGLVPATKYLGTDSKYSQHPGYLSHNCLSGNYSYADFVTVTTLLSYLSSNATGSDNNRFYKTDVDTTVFGLYMCRGGLRPHLCGQCIVKATQRIASECRQDLSVSAPEAIIWYNNCLVHYSQQNFFYKMSTSPRFELLNVTNVTEEESPFKFLLSNALAKVSNGFWHNDERYQTKTFALNDNQTLYVLAQCTPDLSNLDCVNCLYDVIETAIPWSRLGSVGGRVLYPSCTLRFELFQFYENSPRVQVQGPPRLPAPPTGKKGRSRAFIIIVAIIVGLVILFSFCCYLLQRKARKSYKTILKENCTYCGEKKFRYI